MKKFISYLFLFLVLFYCNVNIVKCGNKEILPELNAYPYYKKAIELITEAKEAKTQKKWDIYQKKMEESIELIKEGNKKPFFIPLEEYRMKILSKNLLAYNHGKWATSIWFYPYIYIIRYRRVLKEYGRLGDDELFKWRKQKKTYEFETREELIKTIEDLSALAKCIQMILYSPTPFPFTSEGNKTLLEASLKGICKDLEIIYKKYKLNESVKEMEFIGKRLKGPEVKRWDQN